MHCGFYVFGKIPPQGEEGGGGGGSTPRKQWLMGGSCPQSLRTMPNYWFRCLTQNPKKNPEVCDDCLPLSAAPPDVVVDNSPTMLPILALNVALVMVRTRLGVLMATGAPPMNKNYLPCNKQTFICIGYSHYALYMFIPKQVVMVACHYLNCLQMLW